MKKKLVVVVGPTASGKSDLTFQLAQDLQAEIIVCDAYQVYQEISKGINKPEEFNLKTIKHHFVNAISIYDEWNIKIFKKEIDELIANNPEKTFILEGGSNLYIHSLIHNYNLKELNMNLQYDDYTNEELYEKLKTLDEQESQKISVNNRKRLIQALRIIETNNEKKSILDQQNNEPLYDFYLIRMKIEREKLYQKINDRADKMFTNGWIDEVKQLMQQDKAIFNLNALKAIGYQEIFCALNHNFEVDIDLIKQKTRNYAKRQETWIKNKFSIDYEFNSYNQYNDLLENVKQFIYVKKPN